MKANDCRKARQEIDQSELGQRLSEKTVTHVANCEHCARFSSERGRLRELAGSLQSVTAPADFEMRLRARIARARNQPRRPNIFRVLVSTPAIAVAAALVILVAALVWINQQHRTSYPNQAVATSPGKTPSVELGKNDPVVAQTNVAPVLPDNQRVPPRGRKPVTLPLTPTSEFPSVSDFSSRRAEDYKLFGTRSGEVSLTAPANPTIVSVYDENGRARKILLPPISFGSQRLTDARTPASMKNVRDW